MKAVIIVAVALASWSCQSSSTSASGPDPHNSNALAGAAQETKKDAATVVLDPVEQRNGHIVVASAGVENMAATLTIPGRLTFNEDQTWHVGAIASGRIENISARVGDAVSADQILARLHSHEVHEARAGYQEAQAELERARSAQVYAGQRRDRAARLFELKAGSRQDLETAEADLRNAQASVERAESELEKERAHLHIFRLPVKPRATGGAENDEEDDIPIVAPAAGLVLDRKATLGSVVNSGDELFVIANISSLWMIAAANEVDLSKLHPGQPVHVQVRAYPGREFTGRILKLGEELDPATRTLQIRIAVPNPQGLLKPEMYATASVQQAERRTALVIPEEAVQEIDGVSVVFVEDSRNEFRARTVEPGQHADGGIEIVEGLKRGEAVVVKGGFTLKSQLLKSVIQDQ
jgi:multidrug efflux pump subunit AcrA (membrane-fusion protein)